MPAASTAFRTMFGTLKEYFIKHAPDYGFTPTSISVLPISSAMRKHPRFWPPEHEARMLTCQEQVKTATAGACLSTSQPSPRARSVQPKSAQTTEAPDHRHSMIACTGYDILCKCTVHGFWQGWVNPASDRHYACLAHAGFTREASQIRTPFGAESFTSQAANRVVVAAVRVGARL